MLQDDFGRDLRVNPMAELGGVAVGRSRAHSQCVFTGKRNKIGGVVNLGTRHVTQAVQQLAATVVEIELPPLADRFPQSQMDKDIRYAGIDHTRDVSHEFRITAVIVVRHLWIC